jgi:hypothetical protein
VVKKGRVMMELYAETTPQTINEDEFQAVTGGNNTTNTALIGAGAGAGGLALGTGIGYKLGRKTSSGGTTPTALQTEEPELARGGSSLGGSSFNTVLDDAHRTMDRIDRLRLPVV